MPRIKPLTETELKNRKIMAELAAQMAFEKKKAVDVARYLGMSQTTFSRRKNDPGTFTVRELRDLKKIFPRMVIEI